MVVAKGSNCPDFPQPKDRASFSPHLGRGSQTGSTQVGNGGGGGGGGGGGSYAPAPSGGATNPGSGNYRGYDPRLYEAPPQSAPRPVPPAPAPPVNADPEPEEEPLPELSPDPDQP
jgi:hypothetical protein